MARYVAKALRENRSPRADRGRRSAPSQPFGSAASLLALQRQVGNQAVSHLVASSRQIARVLVVEARAEQRTNANFAKHYPPWLDAKTKASGLTETELLSPFTLDKLKAAVEESATHHRNVRVAETDIYEDLNVFQKPFADAIADTKKIIGGQLGALAESATLKKYAPERLKGLGGIIETMEVLRPDAFEARYFAAAQERGLKATDQLATIDFTKGFVVSAPTGEAVRKRVCLRFGSGANLRKIHPAVHEVIHALADIFAPSLFGHNLNEGVTELITRQVLGEVGPGTKQPEYWKVSDAYGTERGMVATMMREKELTWDDVLRAYFSFGSMSGEGPREGVGTAIEKFREGERAPESSAVVI
jgi:hypothetical protein